MQAPAASRAALAGVDQWLNDLSQYGGLERLKNVFTQKIPYTVFKAAVAPIATDWSQWRPTVCFATQKQYGDSHAFISDLCITPMYRLSKLLEIAGKVKGALEALKSCLTGFTSLAEKREACDNDTSSGYMADIHHVTMEELGMKIQESQKDFRLLACALGFDSLACRAFSSPSEVLNAWLERNPKATVQRLHFEASQCGMEAVSRFLENISLDATPDVTFEVPTLETALERPVTVFDKNRVDTINEELGGDVNFRHMFWEQVYRAFPACNTFAKKLTSQYIMSSGSTDYPLWGSQIVPLGHLLALFRAQNDRQIQQITQKLLYEVEMGLWEPSNSKGITYTQVSYLAKALAGLEEAFRDTVAPPDVVAKRQPWDPPAVPLDTHQLDKELFGNSYHEVGTTLHELIFLFWQKYDNWNVPLETFVERLEQALLKNGGFKAAEFAKILRSCHINCKPYRRHFDPNLALENLSIAAEPPRERQEDGKPLESAKPAAAAVPISSARLPVPASEEKPSVLTRTHPKYPDED